MKNLLELCHAVKGTYYHNPNGRTITTLENAGYCGRKAIGTRKKAIEVHVVDC